MADKGMKRSDTGDDDILLKMDGFDDCIVGVVEQYGGNRFILYDTEKVIYKLMTTGEGMSREDAEEFHSFNQASAYHGPATPGFLYPFIEEE